MARFRIFSIVTVAAAGMVIGLASVAAAETGTAGPANAGKPHIVAKPSSVVVNATTQLTGTGFPPGTTLTLKECSQQTWVVMINPCINKNVVQVTTDSRGRFHQTFTVKRCPAKGPARVSSQSCYIGEPVIQGVDTETLAGVVAITVSGH